jgi:hypothetical protein
MKRIVSALVGLLLLGVLSVPAFTGGSAGVAFTDFANIFTSNQRINAGLGVNVAPGATGTISSSDAHFERGRSTAMGEWTAVSYSAGNFTGSGSQTWTVDNADIAVYSYMLVGKTLYLKFAADTTTVGGTPSTDLLIAIPGGFTANHPATGHLFFINNGVNGVGLALANNGGSTVRCLLPTLGNWTASTNNTSVYVMIFIEVN